MRDPTGSDLRDIRKIKKQLEAVLNPSRALLQMGRNDPEFELELYYLMEQLSAFEVWANRVIKNIDRVLKEHATPHVV